MQRLDAGAVAREQQRPRPPIPQRESEHAAEPGEALFSPLLVRVNDGLCVARRVEAVAGGFELLPEVPGTPRLTGLVLTAPGPQRKGVPFALELRVEGPDAGRFTGDVALRELGITPEAVAEAARGQVATAGG